MKVNIVYDIEGPYGYLPNGMNYKYVSALVESDWNMNHITHDIFQRKQNFPQYGVFDSDLNLNLHLDSEYGKTNHDTIIEKIGIHEITQDTINLQHHKEYYFFPITLFGNLRIGLSNDLSYHENENVFDIISNKSKKACRSIRNFYFILDYSNEGDIREEDFKPIHEALKRNKIREDKVIFISSAFNTQEIYDQWFESSDNNRLYRKKIKVACFPWALEKKGKELNNFLNKEEFNFNDLGKTVDFNSSIDYTEKTKKALCLNRRLRPHRMLFVQRCIDRPEILNDILISYDYKMMTNDREHYINQITHLDFNTEYKKEFTRGINSFTKHRKKNTLDYDDLENVWGFGFENANLYRKSYFSLVTETLFFEPGVYLSEKIFKPIQHLHPFVVLSTSGTLRKLKELGFKTFSEVWDESYDDERDDSKRFTMVWDLFENLCNKSEDEWNDIYKKIVSILLYNREHLLSFEKNSIDDTYQYFNLLKNHINNEDSKETYLLLSRQS